MSRTGSCPALAVELSPHSCLLQRVESFHSPLPFPLRLLIEMSQQSLLCRSQFTVAPPHRQTGSLETSFKVELIVDGSVPDTAERGYVFRQEFSAWKNHCHHSQ